jgi:hypothetical protein
VFRCHICGKICIFTIDYVHGHLQSHKMTWSVYKALYLSGDSSRPGLQLSSADTDSASPVDETVPVNSMDDDDDIMLDLPLQVSVVFLLLFFFFKAILATPLPMSPLFMIFERCMGNEPRVLL